MNFKKYFSILKFFYRHFKNIKFFLFLFFFASLGIALNHLIYPVFFQLIIDEIVKNVSLDQKYNELMDIFFYIVILSVLIFFSWRIFEFSMSYIKKKVIYSIYKECFDYTLNHSYNFFINNHTWSLVKKIDRCAYSFKWILDIIWFDLIRMVCIFVWAIYIISLQNFYIALIYFFTIIVFWIVAFLINIYELKYEKDQLEEDSKYSWYLADTISNFLNIKIFWFTKWEIKQNESNLKLLTNKIFKRDIINNFWYMILSLITIWVEILVIYLCIIYWFRWELTAGFFILILDYNSAIFWTLFSASYIFWNFFNSMNNAYEMIEILETPNEVVDKTWSKNILISKWFIEFKNIKFWYNKDSKINLFENFNLKIYSWEKIWIVGKSWSWKSSLIKLLFRFVEIDWWEIMIDWINIQNFKQDNLRSQISYVPQEPILFHRSIYENIVYWNENVKYIDVVNASKIAHCFEFISKLENWFESVVWERWVKLSWWERQRVAFARALLTKNKILVLDEATSSLDSESEKFIQDSIENLIENKTTIVIAHRLSTILKMDRIVVLEDWKIKEVWNHLELISKNWTYKKLWDLQSWSYFF